MPQKRTRKGDEMAVYRPTKDTKVWWYDFIFEGQRVRESAKTRSKTVAKDAERARRREMEESYNGIKRRDRAKLFAIAANEWLSLKGLTLAASSQRIERHNLGHLRPHFENRLVTDIQAKDVSRYQHSRLAEGASPKTVNLEVGTLRAILRRHRVWGEIQQDVRMLATCDDVGHALTSEEEAALLSACLRSRSNCLYPAVMIALNTGMRYSEIRLLQWKQIDFAARFLKVGKSKTRTGTGRVIPLNARLLNVLEMRAAQFPKRKPDQYVFPFEKYAPRAKKIVLALLLEWSPTTRIPHDPSVTGKKHGKRQENAPLPSSEAKPVSRKRRSASTAGKRQRIRLRPVSPRMERLKIQNLSRSHVDSTICATAP
jgi:integrase